MNTKIKVYGAYPIRGKCASARRKMDPAFAETLGKEIRRARWRNSRQTRETGSGSSGKG